MEPGLSEEDVEQQKDTNLVITFPAKKPYNVLLKRRIAKLHRKMDMLTGVKRQWHSEAPRIAQMCHLM